MSRPPLCWQVRELHSPGVVYGKLMDLIARLAELGLVHCDFNEFNVLVCAVTPRAGVTPATYLWFRQKLRQGQPRT